MKKFKTVVSASYDVEAETKEEAEEKALAMFEEDMLKASSSGDHPADWMGVNTEEL